jgi:hypothetical protein
MKKSIKIILSIFFIVLFSCSENLNEKNELNYSEKDLNIAKRESTLDIQKLKDEYRIILTSESYYEYTTAAKEFVEFIPKDLFFSNHEEFTKWINDGSHVIYFGSVSNANKFYNNLIHKTTIFYQKYSEFYNDFAKLDEAKKNELILLEEELTLPIDFQQEINSGPCENTCINDAVDCLIFLQNKSYKKKFNIFNIGSGKKHRIREILNKTKNFFGIKEIYFSNTKKVENPDKLIADIKKIKKLGWQSKEDFDDQLKKYVKWFKINYDNSISSPT